MQELDKTIEADNQELGALKSRLDALEKSEELTGRLQELRNVEANLAATAEEWASLRIARFLLEQTRVRFEKERQPDIIRRAGSFMGELTGGRYPAVIAPSSLREIKLADRDGAHIEADFWSRGTSEQLYLALRFAFIEHYCSKREPLPIVMDDVLVHADGYERLGLAAAAIARVAEMRQVLYFTCRPADADVLCNASPEARRFELINGGFSLKSSDPN